MKFKHFAMLAPEQPRENNVIHIRDKRKAHTTVKTRNRLWVEQGGPLQKESKVQHQQSLVLEERLTWLSFAAGQLRGKP